MKSINFCYILFTLIILVNTRTVDEQLEDFKAKFAKIYMTTSEELNRKNIFETNIKIIQTHNKKCEKGESTSKMGITKFTDMSKEEVVEAYKNREILSDESMKQNDVSDKTFVKDYPDTFDWRDHGAVLPPGSKGVLCGAEWAFSIAATVESHLFIYNGTLEQMSVQYIVDCCSFSDGCNVQVPLTKAYDCLERNGGVSSTSNYVYFNGIQGKCLNGPNFPIRYVGSYNLSETDMQELIANVGPLTVTVDSFNLYSYSSGIMGASDCPEEISEPMGVVIVGYGTENDVDYWIVKNSWGTGWGEQGYFRLARNLKACGINREVFYPVIEPNSFN